MMGGLMAKITKLTYFLDVTLFARKKKTGVQKFFATAFYRIMRGY
jgi:hypothetical protein